MQAKASIVFCHGTGPGFPEVIPAPWLNEYEVNTGQYGLATNKGGAT